MNSLQLRIALLESINTNVAVCAKDQLTLLNLDSFAIIVNTEIQRKGNALGGFLQGSVFSIGIF
jgi:hypothetical protein